MGEWEDLRSWYSVLWAPWRMVYIKKTVEEGATTSCIFCEALKMNDEKALIIYRGKKAYIIMNKYPYNTGHLMIVPYRHVASLESLSKDEILEMGILAQASLKGLRKALSPHGFNVGINIGEVAGAGVAEHVHIHIVPRWKGDANFITITAGTKVLPQMLEDTYKIIKNPIVNEIEKLVIDSKD